MSRKIIQWHRKQSPDAPKDLSVKAWKIFLAAKGREGTAPPDLLTQMAVEKLAKLKLEREKMSDALKVSRGELIPVAEVSRFLQDVVGVGYWAEFDRLSFEMPPNLVGLSAAQMFIEFKKEKEKMVANCRDKVESWIKAQERKHV